MNETNSSEVIALEVFTALCSNEDDLGAFLGEAGSDLITLSSTIQEPETLAAVIDYVLNNEDLLLRICADIKLKPAAIWKARLNLPGSPDQVHWSA